MSEFKIAGCCTICDAPVLEAKGWHDDASRITFGLCDGATADMTFCGACATALDSERYNDIWRKVMRSWLREIGDRAPAHQNWLPAQFSNGLLVELGRIKMKDIDNGTSARA